MILFLENGRLGNQLFQYCGIKKYLPNHRIIFFGCDELNSFFDNIDAQFISKEELKFGLLKAIIDFLVSVRIFGLITQESEESSFVLKIQKGLFWRVLVPKDVFFQHRDIAENIKEHPLLKPELFRIADRWIKKKGINPNQQNLVFVHIRRGDYLHWPSNEFPAVLSLAWYERAISFISETIRDPVFVLMSDDQHYLYDVFEESENFLISNNVPEVDLAIIARCTAGILSASSFAWWAAWYSRVSHQDNLPHIYLAPTYWAGHRRKEWYPQGFETKWIQYLE